MKREAWYGRLVVAMIIGTIFYGLVPPQAFGMSSTSARSAVAAKSGQQSLSPRVITLPNHFLHSVKTVHFHRERVVIPGDWPVYDLVRHPSQCVRFDRPAVYLGQASTMQRCPAHLVGGALTIQLFSTLARHAHLSGSAMDTLPTSNSTAHLITGQLPATHITVRITYAQRVESVFSLLRSLGFSRLQIAPSRVPRHSPASLRPRIRSRSTTASVYTGNGFETCAAPSTSTMQSWLASPYRAVGIYIGGIERGCAQPNLTSSWVSTVVGQGWHLIPTYVGPQAPCSGQLVTIDPTAATTQGTANADDAITQATQIGLGAGNPIYYDMENYPTGGSCTQAVLTFLSAWTNELHAHGYISGVYSSGASGIHDVSQAYGTSGLSAPDDIWFAWWNGRADTDCANYCSASLWTNHQRLHQYQGGHDETYGGTKVNIDTDYADSALAPAPVQTIPAPPSGLWAAGETTDVHLGWADNSNNEDGFNIYRDGSLLTTVTARTQSYYDRNVKCNDSHTYQVSAFNGAGESARSSAASATTAPCSPDWSLVPTATLSPGVSGQFSAVSVLDASHAFAVGSMSATTTVQLVEQWDGSTWQLMSPPPLAGSSLNGVVATSPTSVWAVGTSSNGSFIEHWNGSAWSTNSGAQLPSGSSVRFSAITAISDSDIYAVGSITSSGNGQQQLVERWDGSTWTIMSTPGMSSNLNAVLAISPNDIYVGGTSGSSGYMTSPNTLLEHWDGTTWNILVNGGSQAGGSQLVGISASSSRDVWWVGTQIWPATTPSWGPQAQHWDGRLWANLVPTSPSGTMVSPTGIADVSPAEVYVVGYGGGSPYVQQWNGTAWNPMTLSSHVSGSFTAVSAGSDGTILAAGSATANSVTTPLIEMHTQNHTPPDKVTGVSATPSNGQATVSWATPGNGASPLTGYVVDCEPGSHHPTNQPGPSATSAVVPNLTNGTTYSCTVAAINAIGTGQPSDPVTVTPRVLPSAPTNIAVAAGNHSLTVTWGIPGSDGGAPIDRYDLRISDGHNYSASQQVTDLNHLQAVFTGLANGTTYTISVTAHNAAGSGPAATSGGTPAVPTATRFQVDAPSLAVAGNTVIITITAEGAQEQTATEYTGTVLFSSTDTLAALPTKYTFALSDNGVHTFAVTLMSAGNQTITATDTATSSIVGSSPSITVNPGSASELVMDSPTTATAGASLNVTATALDAYGNTASGYRGTVHLTSNDPNASLPADYSFQQGDNGAHSFPVIFKTAGSRTITATDTATSSIVGSSPSITVNPGSASELVMDSPTTATAGASLNVTATALDAYGNTASGYRGTVHLTSNDPNASLPADYSFQQGDNGAHSFPVIFKTAGNRDSTVTDTSNSVRPGSSTVTVNPAAADHFDVTGPSMASSGISFDVTVTVRDVYGNTATGYNGTVATMSSDTQATIPTRYSFTSIDAGAHTFNVTLKSSGAQTVTFTDAGSSTITGSLSVTIAAVYGNLITNGGLENELATWSTSGLPSATNTKFHAGTKSLLLCNRNTCNDQVWQTITLPTDYKTLKLSLWYYIATRETSTACNDRLYVGIRTATGTAITGSPSVSKCNRDKTTAWVQLPALDLSATLANYKGKQVQVYLQGTTNASLATSFFIDDLSLVATPPLINLVQNPGFESLLTNWTTTGTPVATTTKYHTGNHSVLLCNRNSCNDQVSQTIAIPSSYSKLTVSYWYFISTKETSTVCKDHFYVRVTTRSGTPISALQSACNIDKTTTWIQKTIDLSSALNAYKGQPVLISFQGSTNASLATSFFVDDVATIVS